MRIALITGSRSDWGLVEPMLRAASERDDLTPLLIVMGSHMSERHGRSIDSIRAAGWRPAACVDACEADDSPAAMTRITGRLIAGLADTLDEMAPDWVVVTGDRFDAFAAATAATTLAIPLAHVAGGATDLFTNYDGNLRNAMTKLAALHFVAHRTARQDVRAVGGGDPTAPWSGNSVRSESAGRAGNRRPRSPVPARGEALASELRVLCPRCPG